MIKNISKLVFGVCFFLFFTVVSVQASTCGTAAKNYTSTDTAFSGTFCGTGDSVLLANPIFPAQGGDVFWVCYGTGLPISCTASKPASSVPSSACGSAAGKSFTIAPTSNLCASGYSAVIKPSIATKQKDFYNNICGDPAPVHPEQTKDYNWYWYCGTSIADSVQCSAIDPNALDKASLGATEIESGSFLNSTNNITAWYTWYCSRVSTITPSGYELVSCSDAEGSSGSHGGCHCCSMIKVIWKKKTASTPGACTSCATWSACSNGTKSCTVKSPAGCTGTISNQTCGTPGACNNTVANACSSGSATSKSQSGNTYYWYCASSDNGTTSAQCSYTIPTCTSCATWSACSNGTKSCTVKSPAGCTGTISNQTCGTPGACNNTVANACSSGSATSKSQSGNTYYWKCASSNNGSTSVQCSYTIPTCACSVWSVCYNGTQSCTTKTPAGCTGTIANRSCGTPGVCSAAHYNCTTGTSTTNLQGGGFWVWVCQGLNGGTNKVCSQSFPTCTYTYGSWSACSSSGNQTRTATAINSPCTEGTAPVTSQSCTYTLPTCTYTYGAWSVCSGGTQTRTAVTTNSPCTGTPVTTQSCSSGVGASNFMTPLDLVSSEQCLWCENYYDTTSVLKSGKNGSNLDFAFTYNDSTNSPLANYQFILTAENVSNPESATNKISISKTATSANGTAITVPGFSVSRAGFNASSKQLAYGVTYNWWVKVKNSNGTESAWIKSDNPFATADHQWPKVAVVADKVQVNIPTQFCSTAINSEDPCLSLCWKPSNNETFNFANPSTQLQSSAWKCSVCYDASGNAILCQNAPVQSGKETNFSWDAESGSPMFPASTGSSSWWKYEDVSNGRYTFNPVVKFRSAVTDAKIKLTIYGSECPLAAGVTSKTIRPSWIEK